MPADGTAARRLIRQNMRQRSIRALEREMGEPEGYISTTFRNVGLPTVDRITRIARAVGVPPRSLLEAYAADRGMNVGGRWSIHQLVMADLLDQLSLEHQSVAVEVVKDIMQLREKPTTK